jgi:uncharacterized protein DUF1877
MNMEATLIRLPTWGSPGILEDVSVARLIMQQTAPESGRRLELDEAWAPLHFGLTGEPPVPHQKAEELGLSWNERSLENVLMGGEATPLMTGFGPARYLSPNLVRSIAAELSKITPANFRSRIEPQTMVEERVLPDSWDADAAADLMQDYFAKLRAFYDTAATHGDGLLIAIG